MVDLEEGALVATVPVAAEPWAVSSLPDGRAVVLSRGAGTLSIVDTSGVDATLRIGAEPGGLALSPRGTTAYVTLSSDGDVAVVDLATMTVTRRIPVDRVPWTVAVTDDGDSDEGDERVIVAHRFADPMSEATPERSARVSVITPTGVDTIRIGAYAFGFPNVLEAMDVIDGAVVIAHLLAKPGPPHEFNKAVSGAISTVSTQTGQELTEHGIHLNEATFSTPVNFPRSVAASRDGRELYVALAGSDAVMGIDRSDPGAPKLLGFWPTGRNPRGIVVSDDGSRAYVMNYLSRDVSVLDLGDHENRPELVRIAVAPETLDPTMLAGKVLFNSARDPRMSRLGWLSCASCHIDGGADGITWLTPDGPRQTMPLWNLAGTAPFHASATRDEVQDFEVDIEVLMAGIGLAPGEPQAALGAPNAGRSPDLDALAHFVLHGFEAPRAPDVDPDSAALGRDVFDRQGCAGCHAGPNWSVSSLPSETGVVGSDGDGQITEALFDVGSFDATADVLGASGFDVPTLLGLHASAPYLHDGSAHTLEMVLTNPAHAGGSLASAQLSNLAAFLRSIDLATKPFARP